MWSFDEFIDDGFPRNSTIETGPSSQASTPQGKEIGESQSGAGIPQKCDASAG